MTNDQYWACVRRMTRTYQREGLDYFAARKKAHAFARSLSAAVEAQWAS